MTNTEIAEQFSLLAALLEIRGENPFKIKSYSRAAAVIEDHPAALAQLSDDELYAIKGIGQAVGEKVRELQHTGSMKALEALRVAIPAGVIAMLDVKGLSPKKISTIWKALEIETLEALEETCQLGRLAPVKGFGEKTQATLLDAIRFYRRSQRCYRFASVRPFAEDILSRLEAAFPGVPHAFTGDYRRQLEVLETVELVSGADAAALAAFFAGDEAVLNAAADHLQLQWPGRPQLLIHTAAGDFPARLFRTTGAPAFLAAFGQQYVLPQDAVTEADIFTANGLAHIPAPLREEPAVLQQAATGSLPELIRPSDIRGIIHAHSTYSDGAATLEAMATAVRDKGYEYLVITDHSQAAFYANGLKPEDILRQHAEIDVLNRQLAPFRIFKGIEADILGDGRLDYHDDILASFDLVIASVHSNLNMSGEKATQRLLTAIAHPQTRILGHPTGRQLLVREGYPIDHKAVIDACIAHNVVIEINANPRRLDLDWRWIRYALDQGALLSVNPDAHQLKGIDDVYFGVLAAQKGGLTAGQNLSSFSLQAFEAFLQRK